MAIIKKKKKEYNPEIKLSHRSNLVIQLVAFIIFVYGVFYSSNDKVPIFRIPIYSFGICFFTVFQCAFFTFKGGKFVLSWFLFGLISVIFIMNFYNDNYKISNVRGFVVVNGRGYRTGNKNEPALPEIHVNPCGCPNKELYLYFCIDRKDIELFKSGDTLLGTYDLYKESIFGKGFSEGSRIHNIKRNFTATEKEEYTKPSYWYYSFFPSCVEDYGCNIVYKVPNINGYLAFTDICGNKQNIPSGYKSVDTVLVYKNINPDLGKKYEICSQKINTPENWDKISDYGYLFENDIYSKEEVEKECPGVKQYVEKFKERNKQ